jgi:hypothetical protein
VRSVSCAVQQSQATSCVHGVAPRGTTETEVLSIIKPFGGTLTLPAPLHLAIALLSPAAMKLLESLSGSSVQLLASVKSDPPEDTF